MRLFIFLLLLASSNIVTLASDQTAIKADTIETVIYEYDTIYVSSDTIRVTDTIINYQSLQPLQVKEKSGHWSIGADFLPLFSNFFGEKNVIDSLSFKKFVNYSFNVSLQYSYKRFSVGFGGGITKLHDRIMYQKTYNTLINSDSLHIVNNCTSDNYFRYANFYLSIGRKWGKKKIHYALQTSFISDILIDYEAVLPLNQVDNKIFDTSVRKIGWAIMISPSIIYSLGRKFDFHISPCYRYTLNKRNLYPLSNLQEVGIGASLSMKL
jgi:hypothetical protein